MIICVIRAQNLDNKRFLYRIAKKWQKNMIFIKIMGKFCNFSSLICFTSAVWCSCRACRAAPRGGWNLSIYPTLLSEIKLCINSSYESFILSNTKHGFLIWIVDFLRIPCLGVHAKLAGTLFTSIVGAKLVRRVTGGEFALKFILFESKMASSRIVWSDIVGVKIAVCRIFEQV